MTKNSKLNTKDYMNIQTALRYVIHDMRSDYFKNMFIDTLFKIEEMESDEKCVVKV